MSVRCDFCIAPAIGYVSRALQGPFYCAAHQAKAEAAAAAHWAEIEEAQRHAEMEEMDGDTGEFRGDPAPGTDEGTPSRRIRLVQE